MPPQHAVYIVLLLPKCKSDFFINDINFTIGICVEKGQRLGAGQAIDVRNNRSEPSLFGILTVAENASFFIS